MNGADVLVTTAIASGIEVCFTNPGSTEMPVLRALGTMPGIRTILGLFEGVCTGAADGYGRMTGKPAMTLLHQGPGFAHGIANLHNARRARTPLLNLIGEHPTWHRSADPPLRMDTEALTAAVSGWRRTTRSAGTISLDMIDAVGAALQGQISSLIVPHDHQLAESMVEVAGSPRASLDPVDQEAVERSADLLRRHSTAAIMLGGKGLGKKGLAAAARIKAATGCGLFAETLPSCWERGAGLPHVDRTHQMPGQETKLMKYPGVVLAGTEEPVAFLGQEGLGSYILKEEQEKVSLANRQQDVVGALERLADALGAPALSAGFGDTLLDFQRPDVPSGSLTAQKACQTLAALQPEGAIIIDEGITSSYPYYPMSFRLAPHSICALSGGSLGWGGPCAVGAAVACPDRPVIVLEGDGSAMYTLQALWTQARESLNITTLIFSNRSYLVLKRELNRPGMSSAAPLIEALTELRRPSIDWIKLAQGLGVPAVSAATAEELARELRVALEGSGPHLIEVVVP